MKKSISILIACIIILSGMDFSIATHLCGGEIAAVKVSFSGKLAGCGMETDAPAISNTMIKAEGCCQNHLNILKVDNKYNPSFCQIQNINQTLLQVISVPAIISYNNDHSTSKQFNVIPPGIALVNSVSLTDICIFRI